MSILTFDPCGEKFKIDPSFISSLGVDSYNGILMLLLI